MNLETISNSLEGKRVLITGCGYKPVEHVFTDIVTGKPTHDEIIVDGRPMKLNIGAATAAILAYSGATVHMVSKSEEKLANLKKEIELFSGNPRVEYSLVDVMDESDVKLFAKNIPQDKPLYWVQSVGLGAGSYKLKDDNPYLPLEEIPVDLIEAESTIVLKSTHMMMKELLPRFKKQKETRIAIISSMSAIRGYSMGGTHCAAKGAIDRYANAAMLSLYKDNIFVTTIRPGGVDTGMYDNPVSKKAATDIAKEYDCDWKTKGVRLASPHSIGEAVNYVLTTNNHVPSINIVARGQFPHEGS